MYPLTGGHWETLSSSTINKFGSFLMTVPLVPKKITDSRLLIVCGGAIQGKCSVACMLTARQRPPLLWRIDIVEFFLKHQSTGSRNPQAVFQ